MRTIPVPVGLQGGQWIQVTRLRYQPRDAYDLHDHAYAEVFWIEQGEAEHQINGVQQRLHPGDLTIMRPADAHAFATAGGFVMVNVTFRSGLLPGLRERFAADLTVWPWGDAAMPFQAALPPAAIERLQEGAEAVACDASRLAAEGFLIDLLRLLRHRGGGDAAPGWLAQAVACLPEGDHLAAGPGELVRLCGRSAAHVNRAVRTAYGCTTTDLVNLIRLEAAARRLKLTGEGIAGIAAGCGFASLAHFYRAFARRFGATPRGFRRSHQAVGGPAAVPRPVPMDRPRWQGRS